MFNRKDLSTTGKNILKEVSVDCVLFGFHADELKVLLLKWEETDFWTLPSGRIQKNELLEEAALSALKETAGIKDVYLQQFHTFGADRHKYYSRSRTVRLSGKAAKADEDISETSISVGYYALVDFEKVVPQFSGNYQWCEITKVPDMFRHHNDMVEMALITLRKDLRYLPIAKLLPQKFTLREMQKLYEVILDRTFDRRNFHKLLMGYDFLIKLREKRTGTANKAPHLYKINFEKYETALQDGISY